MLSPRVSSRASTGIAKIAVRADAIVLTQGSAAPLQAPWRGGVWHDALAALVEPLSAAVQADVVVRAAHARLFMLPFADALSSESRWLAFAGSRFHDLYGESPLGWTLRVVPERPPRPRLAAALPLGLVRALQAVLGRRLRSVRIDTLVRLDELRTREPSYTGALVDVDAAHALLVLMVDGVIQRVRLRCMAPGIEGLRAALTVEWAALGRGDKLPALAVAAEDRGVLGDAAALEALAPRVIGLP